MNSIDLNHACPYATPEELAWLRTIVSVLPAGIRVVMLGAGPGVMALAVKEGNPGVVMTVVDNSNLDYVRIHLANAGLVAGVNFVFSDSDTAGNNWVDGKITLLIVDANHTRPYVERDFAAWYPHLSPGAWIFFHDYNAQNTMFAGQEQYPGVREAVDNLSPGLVEFIGTVGTAAIVRVR